MSQVPGKGEPLRVAVLSSASGGGAGIAARRVADALSQSGKVSATFIDMVALGERVPDDCAPPGNMSNRRLTDTHFTVEFPGYVRGWVIDLLRQYDVLNIHWASFLLGLGEIDELSRLGMPILFTCHDYYYFTGGCHYPAGCTRNATGCLACPQVDYRYCSMNVIAQNLKWKKRIFARKNVHLSAPSRYLVLEAVKSGLISEQRTHVLRNPYSPERGIEAVQNMDVPRIVLIADSLTERRKGMLLAIDSLAEARRKLIAGGAGEHPFLVDIIGNADPALQSALEESGLNFLLHGRITIHRMLAKLIAACDCLLTCSFEDNWPNVLVEAGAYGAIPVVGPGHGCEEFVHEFRTGEIAGEYTVAAFSEAIISAIQGRKSEEIDAFSQAVCDSHAPDRVRRRYSEVIEAVRRDAAGGLSGQRSIAAS